MRIFVLAAALGAALLPGAASAQEHHGRGVELLFQADANRDGAVTRGEFDAARLARFASLDGDHDAQLTRGERLDAWDERRREAPQRRFANADTNSDGAISRDEFLARPLEMFTQLDANRDGSISAAEHAQMRAHHEQRREGRRERWRERRAHHSDADGVSQAEFAAAGGRVFERLDANHDGRVTRAEAEAAHQAHGGERHGQD